MKAILIHTTADIGRPGPDYQFGWGRLDANAAVGHLRQDDVLRARYQFGSNVQRTLVMQDTLDAGDSKVYAMVVQDNRNPKDYTSLG